MVYDCVDVNLLLGVSENNLASGVSVSVYPNPVSRILTLTYTAEKPVQVEIEIRNVMGQVVGSFNRNMLNAGSQNFNLDVSRYSNGVYTVNTIIGDKVFASKFIKN
jgi:vacuolar-type H+-ATPase subunit D/Vma8